LINEYPLFLIHIIQLLSASSLAKPALSTWSYQLLISFNFVCNIVSKFLDVKSILYITTYNKKGSKAIIKKINSRINIGIHLLKTRKDTIFYFLSL